MAHSLLFLATSSCLYYITNSACSWEVGIPGGSRTLDLSCVSSETITLHDATVHTYQYSLCRQGVKCGDTDMMANQIDDNDNSLCYELGNWDDGVIPTYRSDDGGSFEFEYSGADDGCGNPYRTWKPTFICDNSVNGFSADPVQEGGGCVYTVDIRTKYACPGGCDGGGPSGSSSDDELSGGWIFIICLIGALFLYCIGGYLFMGLSVNKEQGLGAFNDNIPNKDFWIVCPKLVITGCKVTVEFLKGLTNKGGGSGDGDGGLDEPITNE